LDNLSHLQTETVNTRTAHIDRMSTLDMCTAINTEDGMVAQSLVPCLPRIADTIDALAPRVRRGGRVIYVGAGTSGRSVSLPGVSRTVMTKRRIVQARDPRRI
jgi:N-acetylmuramic acid 6-phosphate etherase